VLNLAGKDLYYNLDLLQQGFHQSQAAASQASTRTIWFKLSLFQVYSNKILVILGQVGAIQQAQQQAQLEAQKKLLEWQAFEPYERLGFYGSGVTGLMGGYPGQYQFSSVPNPSPLQTALGTGATLAGIYGALQPKKVYFKYE
jgi:hypothetical protein